MFPSLFKNNARYHENLCSPGIPESKTVDEQSEAKNCLKKISKNWDKVAMVRRLDFDDEIPIFDLNGNDFLEELLPFRNTEAYRSAPETMKQKILTCGWIMYNEKTVSVETEVVTPACISILKGEVPGLTDSHSREVAAETMTDESYHSLLVIKANNIVKEARKIDVSATGFNLPKRIETYQKQFGIGWKEILVKVAAAIVSEVFISDYLYLLSHDHRVQGMNRMVVRAHLKDELVHGLTFKSFARIMYKNLNREQQRFFAAVLPKPIKWFADRELPVWKNMLEQIGFEGAEDMLLECSKQNDNPLKSIDYSKIIRLADEIGITRTQFGVTALSQEEPTHSISALTSKL